MNKNKISAEIRAAREAANLTLRQVGDALGRSFEWVRRIEIGTLAAKPETAQRILRAISRLRENPRHYEPIAPRVRKDVAMRLNQKTSENDGTAKRA